MSKPVILTGIRANNELTIGNYFGAMLPMIDMAKRRSDEYQVNMFIPDLHSFTTPIDHSQLFGQIVQNARLFVAAGLPLDNENIFLYRQSYIPAHSEMTWILDCFSSFGEIQRMTQFREKGGSTLSKNAAIELSNLLAVDFKILKLENEIYNKVFARMKNTIYDFSKNDSEATVGLFNYPVLMAADILLYGAAYIPVGEDQTQHLEFTRDIAERMNARFGKLFTVPEPVIKQHEFFGKDQGLRIKDLLDPTKKMSKSDESGKGVIFLSDDPKEAAKKVMGATTDNLAKINFNRENQPGISNLLEILALLRGQNRDDVVKEFEGQTSYGDFKRIVAKSVENFLADFQSRLDAVDDENVLEKLIASEAAMCEVANSTLYRVQQAVGLRPAKVE